MYKDGEGPWACHLQDQQPSGPVGGASETRVLVGEKGSSLGKPYLLTLMFGLITTPSSGDLMLALEGTLWSCLSNCRIFLKKGDSGPGWCGSVD